MTKVISTSSDKETMAAGEQLVREVIKVKAERSIVIFLEGELGAGKTTFTKGILKGLNYEELVKSPTYNLVEIHETKNYKVFHFDLYSCLLYTSPSPRDATLSRMPSSA